MPGEINGLMAYAFLNASVAVNHPSFMINKLFTKPRCKKARGKCHADQPASAMVLTVTVEAGWNNARPNLAELASKSSPLC